MPPSGWVRVIEQVAIERGKKHLICFQEKAVNDECPVEHFQIKWGQGYVVGIICHLGLNRVESAAKSKWGLIPKFLLCSTEPAWQYNLIPYRVQSFHQVLPGMSHKAVKFFFVLIGWFYVILRALHFPTKIPIRFPSKFSNVICFSY